MLPEYHLPFRRRKRPREEAFSDPVVATGILDRLLHHNRDHHPRRQLPPQIQMPRWHGSPRPAQIIETGKLGVNSERHQGQFLMSLDSFRPRGECARTDRRPVAAGRGGARTLAQSIPSIKPPQPSRRGSCPRRGRRRFMASASLSRSGRNSSSSAESSRPGKTDVFCTAVGTAGSYTGGATTTAPTSGGELVAQP